MGIIPWSVVLLLGTTVALVAGFKNTQIYNRTVEAQQIWSAISTSSRLWGALCCDLRLPADRGGKAFIYRHIAWLTALRFALRSPRAWETAGKKANVEFGRRYRVLEQETSLASRARQVCLAEEMDTILKASNPAARTPDLQSSGAEIAVRCGDAVHPGLCRDAEGRSRPARPAGALRAHQELLPIPGNTPSSVRSSSASSASCYHSDLSARSRSWSREFDGFLKGHMVWLVVPFSVVIGWMYTRSTRSARAPRIPSRAEPMMCRFRRSAAAIEVELRELLGESDLPPLLEPVNGIAT